MDEVFLKSKLIDSNEYDEAIYELLQIYCKKVDMVKHHQLFEYMTLYLDKTTDENHVVSITCFAQLVASFTYSKEDKIDLNYLKNIMEFLCKNLNNEYRMIRKMAIRGISNLCKLYFNCILYIENHLKLTEKLKGKSFFKFS